jgi:hypothetical protein
LTKWACSGSLKKVALKKTSLFLILLGFLLFLCLFLLKFKAEMIDFGVNYRAAQRIRLSETLYRMEDGHYQFKYPPFAAFLYLPLSLLPLVWAKAIWYFVVLFSSVLIFYLSKKLVNSGGERDLALALFPPLVLARFFLRELQLGQINAFLTLIFIIIVWLFLSSERLSSLSQERWAGGLWGLAMALKPYALVFLPYFLLKKKWQTTATGFLFLFLALMAPSLFYGFPGNWVVLKEWISTLSKSTPHLLTSQDNISLMAFLMKWTGDRKLSLILFNIGIVLLAAYFLFLVLKGRKLRRSFVLESSILFILIPLISPLGWDYTLLSSALGVTIIFQYFARFPKLWKIALGINFCIIAFSLYDLLGRNLYSIFMSWSLLTLNFLILIGSLSYLRMKSYC